MIKNLIGDMRGNTQSGHPRHARSPQIVKPPSRHSGKLIEFAFSFGKTLKSLPVNGRENKATALSLALQYSQRLPRQMYEVRLGVLRA